ncbi:Zinc finger protein [Collichthys lucidus]|uniref:Zinc finger protein n=1 Tax=Collichthys lucidus TaxID=240159 RepID=A0A4U5USS1_COLLU|nr:Zinc finger protein [Collichthys lucidus]
MIQPHLDMKPFLQFPMETPPPPHSMSLFHNFNTMDPVQKAVINHTFGVPLIKTKRPVISCNVCQIRFNSEDNLQALETSRVRIRIPILSFYEIPQTARQKPITKEIAMPGESKASRPLRVVLRKGTRLKPYPPTSSPSPPGAPGSTPDSEPSKADEPRSLSQLNGPLLAPGPLPPLTTPPTPPMDSPVPSVCPLLPTPTPPLIPPSSSSPGCSTSSTSSEQPGSGPPVSGAVGTSASSSPSNPETEEDKAKKLLYCSLCKVAVNSLSQLEAHNKGGFICEV